MATSLLKRWFMKTAFVSLKALAKVYTAAQSLARPLVPSSRFLGKILLHYAILPIYKLVILLRIRFGKLMGSARGFVFLLFTNRFVLHAVIIVFSVFTVSTQIQAQNTTASDVGQRSLLYAMVTDGGSGFVEEAVRPEQLVKDSKYLGAETIEVVPGVDFDYEDVTAQPVADLAVPGSIAALPETEQPGVPGQVHTTRTQIEQYAVQQGDTVGGIAQKFGVNVGTVLWANNLTTNSLLRPGTSLRILPVSGVLHVVKRGDTLGKIASAYGVSVDEIAKANAQENLNLPVGGEVLIPGAHPLASARPIVRNNPAIRADVPLSRISNKAVDLYQELVNGNNDNRPKPADETDETPTSKLLWPTRLRKINQYYGWKHTGVDIDGDYTDPIYAAEDGIVTTAGWNSGGYGLQVVIDHPNGMRTRYGHSSKLFVKVGDAVKRGEVIAMVGTTGRSTGTHLHFEVYVNGVRKNPLAYIK